MPFRCTVLPVISVLPLLLATTSAVAQSNPPTPSSWQYWLTAGAGVAYVADENSLAGSTGAGLVAVGSVQYHSFMASARWTRASGDPEAAWDVGLLAGLGSSPRHPFRASVAAGVGRVESRRGRDGVTLPVELQLGWRLSPAVGLGIYTFGSFTGPAEYLGASFAIQVGRLR